jgi:hypothetical protein
LNSDHESETFQFLVKRKVFSLTSYGEEFQIPFAFTPISVGQFHASIIVASLGPARGPLPELESLPSVRWVYPVIGNASETDSCQVRVLKCRSQQKVEHQFLVNLIGETEAFCESQYSLRLEIPKGFEYIRSVVEIEATRVQRSEGAAELAISAVFEPQRPFQQTINLIVGNPLGQEWTFEIEVIAELGKPFGTIVVESLLNKVGTAKVVIPGVFKTEVPFHVYFAAGSASEFSLSTAHGMIEPTLLPQIELPVEVMFGPKMYGKLQKGLLIVDTADRQFVFEVFGKTPEYVPPVIQKGVVREASPEGAERPDRPVRKRNAIRENIENVRITKPRVDQK